MIASGHGRNQTSDSYTDDISDFYANVASGGTGVAPTDSGWQETPDGNLNENPRDPGPQRPLETPDSTTGAGTQLDVEHTLTARDIQKMLSRVTPESVLLDPTSPQYSAMQWLLDDIDTSLVYFAGSGYSERIIQRYTLAVVYHATGGPWGAWETDELWLTEEDECQWFGVRCGMTGATEEVATGGPERLRRGAELNTAQDIVDSQVVYDEESLLSAASSYVTFLDLSNNGLEGVIPEEIGTLWKLGQLLLFDNNIGGAIPWGALTKLQSLHTLYLDRNKLTGNVPNSIGQLSSLKNLDLSGNKLSSSLPNALGNLLDLVVSRSAVRRMRNTQSRCICLRSWSNFLVILLLCLPLFSDLQFICTLQDLRLSDNDFTGVFPREVADLTSLATLMAGGNSIGGNLPGVVGTQLTNLVVVRLHNNEFFGSLPYFASSKLEELHLDGNAFDSNIVIPKSTLLRELYLGKNLLKGTIPATIASLAPRLERLDLSSNQLSGVIPTAALSQLTKAKDIRLDDNKDLSGDVDGVCDALPDIAANMRVDLSQVTCKCCNCC
jgi:Leucine-rich repeat (LRR) protein